MFWRAMGGGGAFVFEERLLRVLSLAMGWDSTCMVTI